MFPPGAISLSRSSRKPSPYPSIPFNLLRLSLLLSALICSGVLVFFVDHLRDEGYSVPWTFIFLLTASLLTLVHLPVTTYIHLTRTLNPATHLISNIVLTVCWLTSLALLTWNLSYTLGHRCTVHNWHIATGIMVCRLFKALTAFAVTGAASAIGCVILDLALVRKSKERGVYNQMADRKVQITVQEEEVGRSELDGEPRPDTKFGEGWDRRSHEGARQYKIQKPIEAKQFGYEAPSQQTSYGGFKDF